MMMMLPGYHNFQIFPEHSQEEDMILSQRMKYQPLEKFPSNTAAGFSGALHAADTQL